MHCSRQHPSCPSSGSYHAQMRKSPQQRAARALTGKAQSGSPPGRQSRQSLRLADRAAGTQAASGCLVRDAEGRESFVEASSALGSSAAEEASLSCCCKGAEDRWQAGLRSSFLASLSLLLRGGNDALAYHGIPCADSALARSKASPPGVPLSTVPRTQSQLSSKVVR
jgi:hypothetical protein